MLLISRDFNLDLFGTWVLNNVVEGFCDHIFRRLFDLPEDCEEVTLSLHDRPAMNRVEVRVEHEENHDGAVVWFNVMIIERGLSKCLRGEMFGTGALDRHLKKFDGQTLHLQCEYEA